MWPRFTLNDLRVVGHFIGTILIVVGLTMLIPLVVALITQEIDPAFDFTLSAGVTLFIGALLRLAKIRPGALSGPQAVLLTGLTWVAISIVGALPLWLSGHFTQPIDAFFDSVSGFTTTGVAVIADVDHLPYAHNIWRLLTHVIGGQGIITIALSIGVFAQSSGAGSLYRAEGKGDSILPNIITTVRFAAVITTVFVGIGTALLTIGCMVKGISFARSVFHAFSLSAAAFGTGGFTPMSTSMNYYHSVSLEAVLMVMMCAGALNFALYWKLWQGDKHEITRNIEMRTLAIWSMLVCAVMAVAFAYDIYFSTLPAVLRRGLFTAVAALSNAGFTTLYSGQITEAMTSAIMFAIILAMALGGATGSTSGGIKALRLALIVKAVVADMRRMISPERAEVKVHYHHMGSRVLTSSIAISAMVVLLLFVVTYLVGGMLAVALGYDPIAAMFESVAATTNAGMTAGIISADMPLVLKVCYMVQMWAGRLEFLTLLALIAGGFASTSAWIKRTVNSKVATGSKR